jgi:DNA-binding MurR/RpiR family transcriptional regulator
MAAKPRRTKGRRLPQTFADLVELVDDARPTLTPSQLRLAALVLDGPQEVALAPAADLAERAKVDESTVVRFAKALGLPGYPALRAVCATELQRQASLLSQYDSMRREAFGDDQLFDTLSRFDRSNIDRTVANIDTVEWERIVELTATSENVYAMGLRACFSMAHLLSYQLALVRGNVHQITSLDGTLPEQLAKVTEGDVFIAVSLAPYATQTVAAAEYVAAHGGRGIAFTDRRSSPLAAASSHSVLVAVDGPLLMSSMTAMTHVLQTLIVDVARSLNTTGADEFERTNAALEAFGTHYRSAPPQTTRAGRTTRVSRKQDAR